MPALTVKLPPNCATTRVESEMPWGSVGLAPKVTSKPEAAMAPPLRVTGLRRKVGVGLTGPPVTLGFPLA